jgi:hypothetical protein
MRRLATLVLAGGLAAVGLAAAVDALRSPPRPGPATGVPGVAQAPRIEGRDDLSARLRSLEVEGVLYMTDEACRRWLLRLPELRWTKRESVPGPGCQGPRPVLDERGGVAAVQVGPNTIEVSSDVWRYRFRGRSPAFRANGILTFILDGRLYEWTGRCPQGVERVAFRGRRTVELCPRPVGTPLSGFEEIVWLGQRTFGAVVGPPGGETIAVVAGERVRARILAAGARPRRLEASPRASFLAVRLGDGYVFSFDLDLRRTAFPRGVGNVLALTWSPDERWTAAGTRDAIHLFRSDRPGSGAVAIPLFAADLAWR